MADGSKIPIAGVFIELGARGVMELAAHIGIQFDDEMKYIDTNKQMETNVPGVFAAGFMHLRVHRPAVCYSASGYFRLLCGQLLPVVFCRLPVYPEKLRIWMYRFSLK